MPHITVTADHGDGSVMLRERVNASDFESRHFASQLVERLGWAVGDAHQVERDPRLIEPEPHHNEQHRAHAEHDRTEPAQPPARVVTTAS